MEPRLLAGRNCSREIAKALVVEFGACRADDLDGRIQQSIRIEGTQRWQQHPA